MKRHRERRDRVRIIKISKGCQICGYKKCARALTFHHPDDNKTKNCSYRGIHYLWTWQKIEEEMNKCIIVCSNCHAEIHDKDESIGDSD